ncbi:MAG: DUF971 domain-containing protein [Acidimicrobiales bacterium]|nr:DUF971 domain-containing protein [Acidimicrobiales bacterium]
MHRTYGHDYRVEDRYDAVDIEVRRSEGLTVTFADGHVAEFDLMRLRLFCPCATCRTLRERGEEAWPRDGSPVRLQITDAELHGAWGLNITWNDGHSTGIYPFEQLRRWSTP